MEIIEIRTQAELDALPKKFKKPTLIRILGGTLFNKIVVKEAWGNAHVEAWGNAYVVAKESVHVVAWGSAHVEAWGSAHVEAWGSAHVLAKGNAHVMARESAYVEAWGNAHVVAWESAYVVAKESVHVVAWGSAYVVAWESAYVVAKESAHVVAWESAYVEAKGNAHVVAWGNALLRILNSEVQLQIYQQVVAIAQDCSPKILHQDQTAQLLNTIKAIHNHGSFIAIKNLSVIDSKITLFKYVRDDFKDHYSGTLNYEPGNVVYEPNWDPDPERQCGRGLHLSASLDDARRYHSSGRAIACEVDLDDIVIFGPDITKVRCRKVKVISEVQK